MAVSFTFNNVSSDTMGVVVTALPSITKPQERVEFIKVPGRTGHLSIHESTYDSIDIVLECAINGEDDEDLVAKADALVAWLYHIEADLVISTQPDRTFRAELSNKIDIKHTILALGIFQLWFKAQPSALITEDYVEQTEFTYNQGLVWDGTYTNIDENNPILEYGGVGSITDWNGAYNDDIIYTTDAPNAWVSLTFTGTYVKWQAVKNDWYGIVECWIDGVKIQDCDEYASLAVVATLFETDELTLEEHTIVMHTTLRKNDLSSGYGASSDLFVIKDYTTDDIPTLFEIEVENIGNIDSRPLIEVTATSAFSISNPATGETFEYTETPSGKVYIDSAMFEVYSAGPTLLNNNATGDFISLVPGENTLEFTGVFSAIKIFPKSSSI